MDEGWFYFARGTNWGPVTLDVLIQTLLATSDPGGIQVWHPQIGQWRAAGSVPEIRQRLPQSVSLESVERMARLYRRLVLLVGAQILLGCLAQVPAATQEDTVVVGLLVILLTLPLLGVLVANAVTAYQLTSQLQLGLPILWAFGMFIPCISIVILLVLSMKAQEWCRRYGIKVGLLGPTKESMEAFRQSMLTSKFD